MLTATEDPPVVDEAVWQAWLKKRNLSEAATLRRAKIFGGIALVLLVLGDVYYVLGAR
jgi:hypothetical protein